MAATNTPTTLSAYLKEVYADSVISLVPEGVKFLEMAPFVESDKEPGGHYNQPVQLTHEFGFSVGSGAFTLNGSIAHIPANAQVQGTSLCLQSQISYDAAARASTSKKAFMKWSEAKFIPMLTSYKKRLEINCLYGQQSIGKVASVSTSGATATVVLTTGTWADGIWAGSETMGVDVYSALTSGTKRTAGGVATVASVSPSSVTVTLTCANSTDAGNIAANDYIFFGNQYSTTEPLGLAGQVSNTTASVFGISAASYNLWAGNSYSCGNAPLTMSKIMAGISKAVGKGLEETLVVMCSPGAQANLSSDFAALRRSDASYSSKKATNGSKSIEFTAQTGDVEIVPSIYVKQGHALAFPKGQVKRIGSVDTTMTMPGQSSEQLVLQLPSNAGYEMRLYSEQVPFVQRPGWCVEFTNIVNQ